MQPQPPCQTLPAHNLPETGPSPAVPLRSAQGTALLAATVLASAVATLDANAVKVAVPAIGHDLDVGVVTVQWIVTTYLLTTAALLLVVGNLADRFGRKRILIVGLWLALVSSVLCAVAPSIETLMVARFIKGVGGALITPISIAMLSGTLRAADRARAIGIWVGLGTLAISIGPYVGGWLVDQVSWRAVFLLSVPLTLACLLALLPVPERVDARPAPSLDVLGGVLAVVGLGGVIYVLTAGPSSGWLSSSSWSAA
jgi:MFS family permease